MKVPTVAAAIYCMPSTGCGGEVLPLPLHPAQWQSIANEVQCVAPDNGGVIRFACYGLTAGRVGLTIKMLWSDGIYRAARFALEDCELAWDQLGIASDTVFTSHDAIDAHQRIYDKIASGTIVRRRGQHGRKSNKSKSGVASGDLDERCYVESIAHCRGDDETLYAAAKRALETTPAHLLPVNLRGRVESVRADAAESYGGQHTMAPVVDILRGGVKAIEKRHSDCRHA